MSARRTARLGAAVALMFTCGIAAFGPQSAQAAQPTRVTAPLASPPPDVVATVDADGTRQLAFPSRSRADLMRMTEAHGAVGALDATRADIAAKTGIRLPDMHPASSLQHRSDDGGPSAAPTDDGEWIALGLTPVGDLNGDGFDDVLSEQWREHRSTTEALDGRTGASLWSRQVGGLNADDWFSLAMGDVSGDGSRDLFTVAFKALGSDPATESCDEAQSECRTTTVERHRWTYGVVSGRDGTTLWSKQREGTDTRTTTRRWSSDGLTARTQVESIGELENRWLFLTTGHDQDGNGVTDVLLSAYGETVRDDSTDTRTAVVLSDNESGVQRRYSLDAQMLSGADGGVIVAKTAHDSPSLPSLVSTPQLVGDQTPDLLWDAGSTSESRYKCRTAGIVITRTTECKGVWVEHPRRVSAIDGATLTTAWSHVSQNEYGWSYAVADLDQDGASEVVVESYWGSVGTELLSGATGALLWQANGWISTIGDDLSGTGRPDVLVVDWGDAWSDSGVVTPTVERRVGATGQLYDTTPITLDAQVENANYNWIWETVVHGGGSAARDVLFKVASAHIDRETGEVPAKGTHWLVESGSGGLLASERAPGQFLSLEPTGDVDADGLTDVIRTTWKVTPVRTGSGYYYTNFVMEAMSVAGVDGNVFWSVPDRMWVSRAGQLDDRPGEDALVRGWADDEGGAIEVRGVNGRTGQSLWTLTFQ